MHRCYFPTTCPFTWVRTLLSQQRYDSWVSAYYGASDEEEMAPKGSDLILIREAPMYSIVELNDKHASKALVWLT